MLSKNSTILIVIGVISMILIGGYLINESNTSDAAAVGTYTDGNWTFNVDGNNATIVSNTATNITALNIPSTVSANGNTYTVTTVGVGGSQSLLEPNYVVTPSNLSVGATLTIPNTVTKINSNAFFNCVSFSGALNIPSSVTEIGAGAFYGCGFTGSLVIPDSVTSIGYSAFSDCSGFTSLNLPDSITSISEGTFRNCGGFTDTLNIPSSVTSIGSYAFSRSGFTGSLVIPDGVTTIGRETFYDCTGFTSLFLPSTINSISDNAFYGCTNLATVYNASSLNITAGSTDNGCAGYYATNIYATHLISFITNNPQAGTVSESYAYIVSGGTLSVSGDTITISNPSKTITATPISTNVFEGWENASGTVTADRTVVAKFIGEYWTAIKSGQTWTYTPTTSIGSATITISGTATSWLTLSNGVISGTAPDVTEITDYELRITATSTQPNQSEVQVVHFTVTGVLRAYASPTTLYLWTGGPIPNSASETISLTYDGFGTGTYTWSMINDGGTGVQVTSNGTLSGIAGDVTSSPVTVTVRITGTASGITQTADVTFQVVIVAKLIFTTSPLVDAVIS